MCHMLGQCAKNTLNCLSDKESFCSVSMARTGRESITSWTSLCISTCASIFAWITRVPYIWQAGLSPKRDPSIWTSGTTLSVTLPTRGLQIWNTSAQNTTLLAVLPGHFRRWSTSTSDTRYSRTKIREDGWPTVPRTSINCRLYYLGAHQLWLEIAISSGVSYVWNGLC